MVNLRTSLQPVWYLARCSLVLAMSAAVQASPAIEVHGLVEAGLVGARYKEPWLNSWMEGGVGVMRFNRDDDWQLSQGVIEMTADLTSTLSFQGTAIHYPDGDMHTGVSEAFFHYAPLSDGWRQRWRVGAFYPAMSTENVDIGWNSPYTYTYSTINSWLAEELRTIGAEWSMSLNGRRSGSPHSVNLVGSLFKANDGIGTLLAWRGWALHNRQTRWNERIRFADYFRFQNLPEEMPTEVEPLEETDGRWGYYLGAHWRYLNSTDMRLYYYDSNADPLAEEDNGQYAWDTRFYSLSLRQHLTPRLKLLAQWLQGDTGMGTHSNGVWVDMYAAYLMLSYHWRDHRFSARVDDFWVKENDSNTGDPNDSEGNAYTLAWRWDLHPHLNVGAEYVRVDSENDNRTLWNGWEADHRQSQWQLLVQARF